MMEINREKGIDRNKVHRIKLDLEELKRSKRNAKQDKNICPQE